VIAHETYIAKEDKSCVGLLGKTSRLYSAA